MIWKQVLGQVQEISASISIILNLLLILLIVTKSPKQLGTYKYLMIYISIFEILFSLIDAIVRPLIFSHGSIFICISTNFSIPKQFCVYLISVWGGFFGSFMGLFALQFIYRYLVVRRSKTLETFKDSRIVLWMMIPPSFGLLWGSAAHFLLAPNPTIDRDIKSIVLEEFNWEIQNVAYVGPYVYPLAENGEIVINEKSLIAIIIVWTLVNTSIFTVAFFAIKCYLELNSDINASKSGRLNHLQHQLFYALVTQTLIPLILMHLPVSVLFLFTMFNLDLGHASALVAMSVAVFPALDPIPVILIIKNYRNAIANVVTIRVSMFSRREHTPVIRNTCETRI
ncbi:unnamed protein product [Caenorhabditis angaria]|uniref:Serpentine receptor class r-10 n=1 Tax=Caenorhabditis angaria TaxID=860376 RepID=A0A9P1MXZ8_9PELO|nr:unnamed protein product [Caenorhabditis angaria]